MTLFDRLPRLVPVTGLLTLVTGFAGIQLQRV